MLLLEVDFALRRWCTTAPSWERSVLVSSPSRPWHSDFRPRRAREPFQLEKATLVDCQVAPSPAQVQIGFRRAAQGASPVLGIELESLCEQGQLDKALHVLWRMDSVPSVKMYRALMKVCTKRKALLQAQRVHAHLARNGLESDPFLGEYVVSTLVKCGGLEHALQVFDRLPHRTVLSWTAVISAYTMCGRAHEALQMYDRMREQGVQPNTYTFVTLLKACGTLQDLEEGKRIHSEAVRCGCMSGLFVSTGLVDMYAKCGSLADAQDVFDCLSERDVVSWNAMLAACVQKGQAERAAQLYEQMLHDGASADGRTFVSILQACGILAEMEEDVVVEGQQIRVKALDGGKSVHAYAFLKGHGSNVFLGSILVNMYGKCGSVVDARMVFDGWGLRDVVLWNAMLAAYAQQGEAEKALQLFDQMQEDGVSLNDRTLVSTIQACGMLAEEEEVADGQCTKAKFLGRGRALHAIARIQSYDSDVFVGSTLVAMYTKCGGFVDALHVFDKLPHRSVVSWNGMLMACIEQSDVGKALQLYGQMWEEGVSPNNRTFVSALQACCMLADEEERILMDGRLTKVQALQHGLAIHAAAHSKGCDSDVFVGSTLVSMYARCGSILDAQDVFDRLSERDVVAWTAMLTAYLHQGEPHKALQLYERMQEEGVTPDGITLVCILQACSETGSLHALRQIHHSITGSRVAPLLASSLIHGYGRCASMPEAQTVFDALPQPDVVSWNALIAGYARQGNAVASIECYEKVQMAGSRPDEVTFLCLLCACTHAGLVGKGLEYFESMSRDHGLTPGIEHYGCVVDLLGRAGHFRSIEHLLSSMPVQPDLAMCSCLMNACRKYGEVVLGKHAFDRAVCIEPRHSAAYVLMSKIYAEAGLWNQANEVSALEQKAAAWDKPTGNSWIEYEQRVETFAVADRKHSQEEEIYHMLGKAKLEPEGRHLDLLSC